VGVAQVVQVTPPARRRARQARSRGAGRCDARAFLPGGPPAFAN